MASYGIVQVRSRVDMDEEVGDTLEMLNLGEMNSFTVIPQEDTYEGMVNKVEEYVAYGEPDVATVTLLLEKRGETPKGDELTQEYLGEQGYSSYEELAEEVLEGETTLREAGVEPKIRLHPPRKGHDGIKHSYKQGGVLGNHGDSIDSLLRRMR